MFCDEALDAIEPIAAGELTPDGRIAAHLASCPNCAAALATARRVEQMLRARPVPRPPTNFTNRTMALVRRRRWRSEQFVDAGFNVALAVIALAGIAAVWLFLGRSGIISVGSGAIGAVGLGTITQHVRPSTTIYAGAAMLFAAALGIWWWTERDATL